jgi:hypothetical protein
MEESILKSTKKILGIHEDYTEFDLDIMTHINSAFSTLTQLGVGPVDGFAIEDDTVVWSAFVEDLKTKNSVKTYVYLKVRMLFDPPTLSYVITALENQIRELEWRMNVDREQTEWADPMPVVVDDE